MNIIRYKYLILFKNIVTYDQKQKNKINYIDVQFNLY